MPASFGAKLRFLREQRNLRQTEVAKALNLASHSHVSYLEQGKKTPSLEVFLRAMVFFHVSADYLLRDDIPLEQVIERQNVSYEVGQIGEHMRQLRHQHQYTQEQLVTALAPISQSFISMVESGQKLPSIDTLVRYAAVFDVSIDQLLFGAE